VYLSLYCMHVTMSISIGLYPSLDLRNANKLHYITLQCFLRHKNHKRSVKYGSVCSYLLIVGYEENNE